MLITNVFEFYYTMNTYPSRLKPLSTEELCRGMSADAVAEYLTLVEQLYNAFYFDVNAAFVPLSKEIRYKQHIERERIFNSLIKLLFKHDAISDDVYCALHQTMPLEFNYIENPSVPGTYTSDSLDDFRLAFEYCIMECDKNNDLSNLLLVFSFNSKLTQTKALQGVFTLVYKIGLEEDGVKEFRVHKRAVLREFQSLYLFFLTLRTSNTPHILHVFNDPSCEYPATMSFAQKFEGLVLPGRRRMGIE